MMIKECRASSKAGNYNTVAKPDRKNLDMGDDFSDAKSQKSVKSAISAASRRSEARSAISKAGSSIVGGGPY